MTASVLAAWGFPHLSAAAAALDLLEDGAGGELLLEEHPAFVDLRRRNAAGALTDVVRAHTGAGSSSVVSSDLWLALRAWSQIDAPEAIFEFRSDRDLYPTALGAVVERLERFASGSATIDDLHVAQVMGLGPCTWLLAHSWVNPLAGQAATLAVDLCWRIDRLLALDHPPTEAEAEDGALRLLVRCAQTDEPHTWITPAEVAGVLGIGQGRVARPVAGSPLLAERYRRACGARQEPAGCQPPARFGLKELLAQPTDAVFTYPEPLGTTALEGLLREVAQTGFAPFFVDTGGHGPGSLSTSLRRQVERGTGDQLSAAGARWLLGSERLVVVLTGLTGARMSRPGLVRDLRAAMAANPALRVIALAPEQGLIQALGRQVQALEGTGGKSGTRVAEHPAVAGGTARDEGCRDIG